MYYGHLIPAKYSKVNNFYGEKVNRNDKTDRSITILFTVMQKVMTLKARIRALRVLIKMKVKKEQKRAKEKKREREKEGKNHQHYIYERGREL